MSHVYVTVLGYTDSAPRERAEMATMLGDEIRRSRLAVARMEPTDAPVSAKGEGLEWATLAVTLIGTLPPLIVLLQSWLSRHRGASVTVELDGDSITLTDATPQERHRLLEEWLDRHAAD